jgi:putative ABC transport system permease protein
VERSVGAPGAGLLLTRKAAADLGVGPGDAITIRHPIRRADGSFALVESQITVSGIHANPLRPFAYMDLGQAGRFGLAGVTNILDAYPAPGASPAEVQREVFSLEGVTLSQAVGRIREGFDAALEQFTGFLFITAVAVLALALLIAFNASRISVEERRREHATMRAFGLPVRSIMGVAVKEGVIVGLFATLVGLGAGVLFLDWMLDSLAQTTVPDVGIERYLAPATVAIAAAVGVVAVAAAPLFLARRLRRMDIPGTLRVME